MNSMPKHSAQAIVASFDSQYWHCGESDEIAAPQLGQLRVCACICVIWNAPAARSGDGALDRSDNELSKAFSPDESRLPPRSKFELYHPNRPVIYRNSL